MSRIVSFDYSHRPFWDMWESPWDCVFDAPSRIVEQNFGTVWSCPGTFRGGIYPRAEDNKMALQNSGSSEVSNNDKEFKVNVDVTHFRPEEISVKTVENRVVVEGKHDERQDDHGLIQRQFKRTYILPQDADPERVKSILSSDGVLCITAPKGPPEKPVDIEMGK